MMIHSWRLLAKSRPSAVLDPKKLKQAGFQDKSVKIVYRRENMGNMPAAKRTITMCGFSSDALHLDLQSLMAGRKAKLELCPSHPFPSLYFRLCNSQRCFRTAVAIRWSSGSTIVEERDVSHTGAVLHGVWPPPRNKGSRGSGAVGATGVVVRSFGGQSVVPWELALFLVEEMKGEGVEPGAVVYTAALAECRWAGEQGHVEYLNQEMDIRGLQIVPGIPGVIDGEPPPSQASPFYKPIPEPRPRDSEDCNPPPQYHQTRRRTLDEESEGGVFSAAAAASRAAKTADTALATIEAMWAGGKYDPSAATCRAALDACAVGGKWERALSLVRDSTTVSAADGDSSENGPASASEDSNVPVRVEELSLEGRWADAFSLVQRKSGLRT